MPSPMAKQHARHDGFMLLEMMLTLFIVSIILLIGVVSIPDYEAGGTEGDIERISHFFYNAQTEAMASKSYNIVDIDRAGNTFHLRSRDGNILNSYTPEWCQLNSGGLERIIFKPDGDANKFGTISLDCPGSSVRFIFQIERGRFRVE
ncbi:type II secretion system protein [Salinicoccus jeotgali]